MPSQVSDFYDDYNFASSFTSEAERIAQYKRHNGDEKDLPSKEQRIETAKSLGLQGTEIHKVVLKNAEWEKKGENLVLFK